MTPSEYQKLAKRTECPQPFLARMTTPEGYRTSDVIENPALLHGCLGIAAEGGELLAEMQRWIWYKKPLDTNNVKEELGDVLWYVAEVCNALGWSMEEVMAANIEKLKIRFPEKYTDHNAAEENRDRSKEANAIRTVSEVQAARGTLNGCCELFPGTACDCLEKAQLLEGKYKEKHDHA